MNRIVPAHRSHRPGRFRLDRANAWAFGVCAGLGRATGTAPGVWRAGTVIAVLLGFGLPVLAYILIAWLAD